MSLITQNFNGTLPPSGWSLLHEDDLAGSVAGNSGQCMRLNNASDLVSGCTSPTFAATTLVTVDLWFKAAGWMYASSSQFFELRNGSTKMLGLRPTSSGGIAIYRFSGGTATHVATSSGTYSPDTWLHLVLTADLSSSGSADLSINGSAAITGATGDFANGAAGATQVLLATAPYTYLYYDDLDVSETGGGGGGPSVAVRRQRAPRGMCRGICGR